jgi:hypothetical protein
VEINKPNSKRKEAKLKSYREVKSVHYLSLLRAREMIKYEKEEKVGQEKLFLWSIGVSSTTIVLSVRFFGYYRRDYAVGTAGRLLRLSGLEA